MAPHNNLLRVNGTDTVDGNGKRIILKGVSHSLEDVMERMTDPSSVLQGAI
jgi:hypothetical protein